jgi:cytochrome b pre-mRNA-processing protein 3
MTSQRLYPRVGAGGRRGMRIDPVARHAMSVRWGVTTDRLVSIFPLIDVRSAMALFGLLGRRRHERTGFELYGHAVRAARDPYYYAKLGVPDTLDGRFDLVGLYVCLVIRRLRTMPPPGAAVAQAVFDAMFLDMDTNLRELGVGDQTIARNVRAMWEAFHGRATAYELPLTDCDPAALAEAIQRNVWRGAEAPGAAGLARVALGQMAVLQASQPSDLLAGHATFASPLALLAA